MGWWARRDNGENTNVLPKITQSIGILFVDKGLSFVYPLIDKTIKRRDPL
jgi:hypothetical protein